MYININVQYIYFNKFNSAINNIIITYMAFCAGLWEYFLTKKTFQRRRKDCYLSKVCNFQYKLEIMYSGIIQSQRRLKDNASVSLNDEQVSGQESEP